MVQNKVFFQNLDGLRFFSFLSVFLLHTTNSEPFLKSSSFFYREFICKITINGNLGVNFFFVLSGFLITYLLVEEKNSFGKIHVGSFYIRRILRIWPLYFLIILIGYTLYIPFREHFLHQTTSIPPITQFIFFTSNFQMALHGPSEVGIVNVLWSIAVEEQFYLFWPLLFILIPPRYYKIGVVAVIIFSIVCRFMNNRTLYIEYHTFSCIGDLAIGALGALLARNEQSSFMVYIRRMPKYIIALIYFTAFFFLLFKSWYSSLNLPSFIFPLEKSLIAAVFLLIILEQNYSDHSFFKLKNYKKITLTGSRTYGLYVLHVMTIVIFNGITRKLFLNYHISLWLLMLIDVVGAFFLSIVLANLSFKYFEKPFLKLKNKFGYIQKM